MRLKFINMQMRLHAPAKTHSAGFTLLELMIVIILMAGISLAVFYSARHAIDKMNYERSQVMVQNLAKAIDLYAQETNRYPCPARTDLARTNANYGREDCGVAGITRVDSSRAIASYPKKPVEITNPDQNQVLIGNLPIYVQNASNNWVALGSYVPAIKKEGSNLLLDPTGNPPLYAVAKKLTDRGVAAGPDQGVALADYGNIEIVNEGDRQLSGVNNDARFVIIAQTYRNGGCVVNRIDYENCDIVADAAPENKADDKFVIAPRALSTTSPQYYDDVVLFNNNIADQKWLTNDNVAITNNIKNWVTENRGLIYMNSNNNNVGIATNTPTEKLDVGTTLRAEMNIRGSLICDKPSPFISTGLTETNYDYANRYFNPDDIIVTQKNAAGVVSTLVRGAGADYTVGAFDVVAGNGRITLNTPPLTTDTITIVKKELCLDPLTVVRKFTPTLLNPSIDPVGSSSLDCPKINFSTTSLRSDSKWWQPEECRTSPFTGCTNALDRSLLEIGTSIAFGGKTYIQIKFRNTDIHTPYSKYYMGHPSDPNYEGLTFYLNIDPAMPAQLAGSAPPTDLLATNAKRLKVFKTLCAHQNDTGGSCIDWKCVWNGGGAWATAEMPADGTVDTFNTSNPFKVPTDLTVWLTPPGGTATLQLIDTHYTVTGGSNAGVAADPGANGSIIMKVKPANGSTIKIERKKCSGATVTLLVEEPPGGLTPQNNVRYSVFGERYLAGTTIDSNGVMRPICKDLEVSPIAFRNGDNTNTCPANQKLRGIQTDGKAICALD